MAVGLREGDAAAKKAVHGKLHVSTKKKTKKEQRERERLRLRLSLFRALNASKLARYKELQLKLLSDSVN